VYICTSDFFFNLGSKAVNAVHLPTPPSTTYVLSICIPFDLLVTF